MSKKCHICKTEMEMKVTSVNTGWGAYKLTVDGVNSYVCPNCGEVTLEAKEVEMLQKLSKSFVDLDLDRKPDYLNLAEVADLLRVSNQTIDNMIKDRRIKAHKFGREWRFIRKDIESFVNGDDSYTIAARGKNESKETKDNNIIKKYLQE